MKFILAFTLFAYLAAYHARVEAQQPAQRGTPITPIGRRVGLIITGYNYTNRYIDDFGVNTIWGGNLQVSNSVNGGGGNTCCVTYIAGVRDWKIPIRFHIDSCTYDTRTDSTGRLFSRTHNFYKEVEVQVNPNIPLRPLYFEVHIYPDNHVEAVVTERSSPARLILRREREDRTPYKQCPNDKRPEN